MVRLSAMPRKGVNRHPVSLVARPVIRRSISGLAALLLASLLSGCLYRERIIQEGARLMDLAAYQLVVTLQQAVDLYKRGHAGSLPKGEPAGDGYWQLNWQELGKPEQLPRSPYSPQQLHILLNREGIVGIDYSPDIQKAVARKQVKPGAGQDLRELLVEAGTYVPVFSFPYRWSGTAPVLQLQ